MTKAELIEAAQDFVRRRNKSEYGVQGINYTRCSIDEMADFTAAMLEREGVYREIQTNTKIHQWSGLDGEVPDYAQDADASMLLIEAVRASGYAVRTFSSPTVGSIPCAKEEYCSATIVAFDDHDDIVVERCSWSSTDDKTILAAVSKSVVALIDSIEGETKC